MKKESLLAVFAKYPEIGKVKTRLGKDIGSKNAMLLYKAMLKDILFNLSNKDMHKNKKNSINYDLAICFAPKNKTKQFKNMFKSRKLIIHPQTSGNLGTKMNNCFRHFFKKYNKIIIIGSDIPTINSLLIEKALNSLKNNDIVLGKSNDGGYYLIGMKKSSNIFSGIEWSTKNVLKDTIKKINKLKIKYKVMPIIPEIDTLADLKKIKIKIKSNKCPNAYKIIKTLI